MNEPVVKEEVFNASASSLWKAFTDKDEMKQWYFELEEFKPEPGFEFQFYGGTEEHKYLHLCKVTEAAPEKKLTYSWRYDGYPGISYVTFELNPAGREGLTKLTLIHEGIESFGNDNPDLAKENFIEGWNEIIGTSLKNYIEKKKSA